MRGKASLASRLQCVLLILVVARTAAAGGVIYVDADAPGANNGSNWGNAYVFLQDALADAEAAEKPVEIHVAHGIYTPDSSSILPDDIGNRSATFQLINEVAIKGGFAGFSETDPNARDIDVYETILSGDLNDDNIDLNDPGNLYSLPDRYDNSSHVVKGSNTDETAVLDGLTITGGYILVIAYRLGGGPSGGAGMLISSGSPTLIDCKFIDNVTGNNGGGLLIYRDSNPTLLNCNFTRNYAWSGGGIFSSESSPTLINCTFDNNYAHHKGGAMFNFGSNPELTDCTFIFNSARSDGGGGMYNRNSNPVISDCIFSENSAEIGGAIYNKDSDTILNTCEFVMNIDLSYSGAVSNGGGQLIAKGCVFKKNRPRAINDHNKNGPTFTDCIFSGNSSHLDGGAAHVASATFNHCIFAGNTALRYYSNDGVWYRSSGGAVYSILTSTFNNCTFSNNWADYGCALYCYRAYVNNCIFWGSEDQIRPDSPDEGLVFVDYSNIQGGWTWPGKGNINTDPCFADPGYWADADDPNIAVEPNDPNAVWVDGDYHLKSQGGRWDPITKSWVFDDVTSPCIDAGDPNSPIGNEPFPNGGRINMGAYGGTAEASMSFLTDGDNKGTNSNNNGGN
jgi:predicted outer membrane repeat protein